MYETLAAADPADTNILIACSAVMPSILQHGHTVVYVSRDGGEHWAQTLETTRPFEGFSGDPACATGPEGLALYAVIVQGRDGTALYRSRDHGITWDAPSLLPINDRAYVVVDQSRSDHSGRIYVNGTRGSPDATRRTAFVLYDSDDGGKTFKGPIQYVQGPMAWGNAMTNGVVLSDGTWLTLLVEYTGLFAGYATEDRSERANATIKALIYVNGAGSLTPVMVVPKHFAPEYSLHLRNAGYSSIPSLAADASAGPFNARVYATYSDATSGRFVIQMTFSSDHGRTWYEPRAISDAPFVPGRGLGPDAFRPVVAVNRDGVVGVVWDDTRDDPLNVGWRPRFSASFDGGETWTASVPVATVAVSFPADKPSWPVVYGWYAAGDSSVIHLRITDDNRFQYAGGDTRGLAVDASGVFHPVWVDNRTGTFEVWTAPVSVVGRATVNGGPALRGLHDVTSHSALDLQDFSLDTTRGSVTLTAVLRNMSRDTLYAPLIVRATRLSAELGSVRTIGAAGVEEGATWDFSDRVNNGRLAPGEVSKPRELKFELSDVTLHRTLTHPRFQLLDLDLKVLAGGVSIRRN